MNDFIVTANDRVNTTQSTIKIASCITSPIVIGVIEMNMSGFTNVMSNLTLSSTGHPTNYDMNQFYMGDIPSFRST